MTKKKGTRLLFRVMGVSVMILALLITFIPIGSNAAPGDNIEVDTDGTITKINQTEGALDLTDGSYKKFASGLELPTGAAYTSVTIPLWMDNMTDSNRIMEKIIHLPSLAAIYVESGNPTYKDEGGLLYNNGGTTLVRLPAAMKKVEGTASAGSEGTIILPSTTTSIYAGAMTNTSASVIDIPTSVASLSAGTISDGATVALTINVENEKTYFSDDSVVAIGQGHTITLKGKPGSGADQYVTRYNSDNYPGKGLEGRLGKMEFVSTQPTYENKVDDQRADKTNTSSIAFSTENPGNYTLTVGDVKTEDFVYLYTKLNPVESRPPGSDIMYYELALMDGVTGEHATGFGKITVTLPIKSAWETDAAKAKITVLTAADGKLQEINTLATTVNPVGGDGVKTVSFTFNSFPIYDFGIEYKPLGEPIYTKKITDNRANKTNADKIAYSVEKAGSYTFVIADSQGTAIKEKYTVPSGASIVFYDLSLMNETGTTIVTDFGKITISIPIDSSWENEKGVVNVLTLKDGTLEKITPTVSMDTSGVKTATFTTTHFSEYGIEYQPVADDPKYTLNVTDNRANKVGTISYTVTNAGNFTLVVNDSEGETIKASNYEPPSGAIVLYYDLSLLNEKGEKAEASEYGTITVDLPVDQSWDVTSGKINVYTSATGKLEQLDSASLTTNSNKEKIVRFRPPHFSEFAFEYTVADPTPTPDPSPTPTPTPSPDDGGGGSGTGGGTGGTGGSGGGNTYYYYGGGGSGTPGYYYSGSGYRYGSAGMPRTADPQTLKTLIVILMMLTGAVFIVLSFPIKIKRRVK